MKVRAYEVEDVHAVETLHAQMVLDYKMPDLSSHLVVAKAVCEEDGKVVAAAMLKIHPEAYLWIDQDMEPIRKWDAIRMLQMWLLKEAMRMGFERVVAYVPEFALCSFRKRLKMLRWNPSRDGWIPWVREVNLP